MTPTKLRTILALALAALWLCASSADAQRRRRRVRRPPPVEEPESLPTEESETPSGEETPPAADPESEGDEEEESSEPDPAEEPSAEPTAEFDPGPAGPDVTPIRTDFVALMDDLVQARMRVSALGAELFRTRISVQLQDRTSGNVAMARMVVHLDGAPVHQSEGAVEGASAGTNIFSGALAPGPHVLTIEVEQRAREDDAYRYSLRESFRFQVVRERLSEVTLILEDGSDMARSFPAGGEGSFNVTTRMRVATRALPSQ